MKQISKEREKNERRIVDKSGITLWLIIFVRFAPRVCVRRMESMPSVVLWGVEISVRETHAIYIHITFGAVLQCLAWCAMRYARPT